ncbi:MAG: response regulator, partial [Chloroflexota bacterium]
MSNLSNEFADKLPHAIIVEDEESLSTIFRKAIDMAGYSVEVIANGQEALNRLANFTPELLLLDLHLPQITGDEIIDKLRKNPDFDNT